VGGFLFFFFFQRRATGPLLARGGWEAPAKFEIKLQLSRPIRGGGRPQYEDHSAG